MVEIILVQKTDVKILNRSCIHLPKRGFAPTVPLYEIVNAILYKLKTGVQWEYLPTASLFSQKVLSWQSVYHHYRKWCRSGAFMDCWVAILNGTGACSTSPVSILMAATHLQSGEARPWNTKAAKRPGPPTPSSLPIGRDCPWPCRNRYPGTTMIFLISRYSSRWSSQYWKKQGCLPMGCS
ncbi:MAG: transposase [Flavobacteriaceae bacterium]|nr:transposase [Flavobacteriaceae bacterium]